MNTEDKEKEVTEEESTAEQAEEEEEPILPAKEPESAKKKKVKRIVFYTVTLTVTVIVSALLSLTVFFKIDEIYVEGTKRYPEKDIIAASMIEKNENLILCNTSPGEKKIIETFPYVEDVHIQKRLFNSITIKITEAKPFLMIKNGEKYFVLSKKGKIIEINNENKYKDVPVIVGVKLKKTRLCDYSEYENDNTKKYLEEVISLVKKYEIKDVSTVDVTSITNIFLLKKNGFKLIIGSPENLDYKFKSAVSIMNEHISETDRGVLDVSMVDAEGAKSYFKSKDTSKAESSKPAEESKQESSKAESSATEESTEESDSEYSEDGENSDEYSEEEDYTNEYSGEEYYDNEYSEEEYYDNEDSEEEYYDDGYSEDEENYDNEYSEEEEYENYDENSNDGGDEEEYTNENEEEQ